MRKLLRIVVILAAIGLVVAALIWKFYVNKPHDDIDSVSAAYSLATEEIWKQYTGDQKIADSLYTGKVIELTGNISRVDKNDSVVSVIFVMAPDPDFGDKSIVCEMYKKHNDEAVALAAGSQVKIKGYCTGYNDPDIKLNKCSVVK